MGGYGQLTRRCSRACPVDAVRVVWIGRTNVMSLVKLQKTMLTRTGSSLNEVHMT
jgi:hypothetical protein